jgi:ribulose bisphosphate carboxylase small subunit
MTYKVVPFTAKITRADSSTTVAQQVQEIIDHGVAQGYEYVRMEGIETNVAPTQGCFGFGAQPGYTTSYQMLIFKK